MSFSKMQAKEIVERYERGETSTAIAASFKCSAQKVLDCLRRSGVTIRNCHSYVPYVPTPGEIADRAAQVRKKWGSKVEESRRVIPPTDPVTVSRCNSGGRRRNGIESI